MTTKNFDQELIDKAEKLATVFHAGQKYGSEDYFLYHIQGVVNSLLQTNLTYEYIVVAYLHDSVEDTCLTLDIIEEFFGKTIREAVDALTKRNGEERKEYLLRCSENKIARIVKLHDAMFNATNCHHNKNYSKFNYYLNTISQLSKI